jgi:hypothetical protein
MPAIRCRCGEVLRYGEIPSPIEWKIISDVQMDDFSGMVDAEEVYGAMKSLLVCPQCGRLWVYWNGFGADPTEYIPALGDRDK